MKKPVTIVLGGLLMLVASGCDPGNKVDFSGRFYVTLGPNPRGTMDFTRTAGGYDFVLTGAGYHVQGTATGTGDTLTLKADLPPLGPFTATLTSTDEGETFTGAWTIAGNTLHEGTLSGTRIPWPTYHLDLSAIPALITHHCLDPRQQQRVSRFRSAHGLDYSDDFESCRSMKHSFDLLAGIDPQDRRILAPFDATVIGRLEDWEGNTRWKGTTIGLQCEASPAFWVLIFHVNLDEDLQVGDRISGGEQLGRPQKADGGTTIAVWVHTPAGDRLLSYFSVLTDARFADYQLRGMNSRGSAIISRARRDADPLTCDGEEFTGTGSLPDWYCFQ